MERFVLDVTYSTYECSCDRIYRIWGNSKEEVFLDLCRLAKETIERHSWSFIYSGQSIDVDLGDGYRLDEKEIEDGLMTLDEWFGEEISQIGMRG